MHQAQREVWGPQGPARSSGPRRLADPALGRLTVRPSPGSLSGPRRLAVPPLAGSLSGPCRLTVRPLQARCPVGYGRWTQQTRDECHGGRNPEAEN